MKEKARKREKGGGGEERVSIREWNKSMWESIVNFPFGNCSAVNWHEWSTIAATTTTHYSVRLTFKTNISMRLCGDTNGLKKKKKKMVDYAHEILLLAHIFQIILLQKWNMQMLKVFEWFFPPPDTFISRWKRQSLLLKFRFCHWIITLALVIILSRTKTFTIEFY